MIMGMPITLQVHDSTLHEKQIQKVFELFESVDKKYSPYREDSEVHQLQDVSPASRHYSPELATIMKLAEATKRATNGYFDVDYKGVFDPSGIVKGWALQKATELLESLTDNFSIEAGGDIQTRGVAEHGKPWRIGIRNPFERHQNVAIVGLKDHAIATSGTAIRGNHIYDPVHSKPLTKIVSLSVIAKHIVDADRMATTAFAMGEQGIQFLEKLTGYEAFMIDVNGLSTQTSGWVEYEVTA